MQALAPPAPRPGNAGNDPSRRWRTLPVAATLGCALAAAVLGWATWNAWLVQPWTRDGRVRVYVVSMAPEVAGRITGLRVRDNQFVRKGDVLMAIDPTDYAIAVSADEAALPQATADAQNKQQQSARRQMLNTLSTSVEEKQGFAAGALQADASVQQARSKLAQARVNLERTRMRSPVNGWMTNLGARRRLRHGRPTQHRRGGRGLVLGGRLLRGNGLVAHPRRRPHARPPHGLPAGAPGHVDSVARGIQVANAQPDAAGLARSAGRLRPAPLRRVAGMRHAFPALVVPSVLWAVFRFGIRDGRAPPVLPSRTSRCPLPLAYAQRQAGKREA